MNIGKTIAELRKRSSVTQGELAKACRISQTALSQIENGISRPSEKNLNTIAEALNTPVELIYLLSLEESKVPKEKIEVYRSVYSALRDVAIKLVTDSD